MVSGSTSVTQTLEDLLYQQGARMAHFFIQNNQKHKLTKYTYLILEGVRIQNYHMLLQNYLTLCLETKESSIVDITQMNSLISQMLYVVLGLQSVKV